MHAWELEQHAVAFYERLQFDPLRPPGITRLAVRHWGVGGSFRYQVTPRAFHLTDDGWEITLPIGADAVAMNMAVAGALAEALIPSLDALGQTILAGALILPMPAARRDVLVVGRNAQALARAYYLPPSVAEFRVRQVLDHGSGERPSVREMIAKRHEG